MFNVSQDECEHESEEELGSEEDVQELEVDNSCDDQVAKVTKWLRLSKNYVT